LVEAISRLDRRPSVLVCASAIGFYGSRGDEILTEASGPGEGFLAELCTAWEAAADLAEGLGLRVVKLRPGWCWGEGGALLRC
jgi:NAD dependent epimerase/dehydratase family enzyme